MKQTIKNFLFKRRFKPLKNKKGFSLLEVLVAVGIIAIISAIAYPTFDDHRKSAARAASDTSAANMEKAFKTCMVLNSFASCSTLSAIKISCPSGLNCAENVQAGNFCVDLKKGTAGEDDFNVCVEMSSQGAVTKTYGGALLDADDIDVCKIDLEDSGGTCAKTGDSSATKTDLTASPIKLCDNATQCAGHGALPSGWNNCAVKTTRKCSDVKTTGTCQSNGKCT